MCSTDALPFNCIDIHAFQNPNDGTFWMNWGSYWNGLYVAQLQGTLTRSSRNPSPLSAPPHPPLFRCSFR